jgi:tetratricopeptide (TPR) repeat protein
MASSFLPGSKPDGPQYRRPLSHVNQRSLPKGLRRRSPRRLFIIVGASALALIPILGICIEAGRFLFTPRNLEFAHPGIPAPEAEPQAGGTPEWFGVQSLTDNPDLRAVRAFFDTMRADIASGNYNKYAQHFNTTRMIAEASELAGIDQLSPAEHQLLSASLEKIVAQGMRRHSALAHAPNFDVTRIEGLMDAHERLVHVSAIDHLDRPLRQRWWLRKEKNIWRAFDIEDLDVPARMTAEIGAARPTPVLSDRLWVSSLDGLFDAIPDLREERFRDVRRHLEPLESAGFPPVFETVRLVLLARAAIGLREFEAAGALVDRASAIDTSTPVLHALRATIRQAQGRSSEALREADAFIARVGDDAMMQNVRGRALLASRRFEEAAEAFRRGLENAPSSIALVTGLGLSLAGDDTLEIGPVFRSLPEPALAFEPLAMAWLDGRKFEAIEVMAKVMDDMAVERPLVAFYRAQVFGRRGELENAIAVLREALDQNPGEQRDLLKQTLRDALVLAGKPLEAYDNADDPAVAFRAIANTLVLQANPYALRDLIDQHAKAYPHDTWIDYYRGEMHLLVNCPDLAIPAFERGLTLAGLDEELAELFESAIARAMYREGLMMEAYERLGSTRRAARTLVRLCINDMNSKRLRTIVEAHHALHPNDRAVHLWYAQEAWFDQDYERVLEHLASVVTLTADDGQSIETYDELLVRSLVRLGRYDEAMDAAEQATGREGDPYLEAVVHATAGRVGETVEIIERCVELGHRPKSFYDDDDLGPIITGRAFAMLHRLYPSPYAETSGVMADGDEFAP